MDPVSRKRPLPVAEGPDDEQLLADTPPQGKRPRARRIALPGRRCAHPRVFARGHDVIKKKS